LTNFAHGVHHLTQQFLVGDVVARAGIATALDHLAAETLDFIGGHAAEAGIQRIAGFQLLAVDQQGVGPWQWVAGGVVKVAKQGQATVFQRRRVVVVLAVEARDEVVDQLGNGGVLADNDEAWRHLDAVLFPELESFLVVTVECQQRGLQAQR